MFNQAKEKLIRQEIKLLIDLIFDDSKIKEDKGVINQGFVQKNKEQRISQEIEAFISNFIQQKFINYQHKFKYLKKIEKNNGSSKAPYELLMLFDFSEQNKTEIYLDLKPINILKKTSSPFMGTIKKYIKRIKEGEYYDLFFIVKYESEKNILPVLKAIEPLFVKNITNFQIYKNWQLQITINKIKNQPFTKPEVFLIFLEKLLHNLKNEKLVTFAKEIKDLIEDIQEIKQKIKNNLLKNNS